MTTATDLRGQYRARVQAVVAAGAVATTVAGTVTAVADPTTVGQLLTVLWLATGASLLNVSWWLANPFTSHVCFGTSPHVNGASALTGVLLLVATAATVVHVVGGGIDPCVITAASVGNLL